MQFRLTQEQAAALLGLIEQRPINEMGAIYFALRQQYEAQIAAARTLLDQQFVPLPDSKTDESLEG